MTVGEAIKYLKEFDPDLPLCVMEEDSALLDHDDTSITVHSFDYEPPRECVFNQVEAIYQTNNQYLNTSGQDVRGRIVYFFF